MPLGITAAARTPQTTRPNTQPPDTGGGGGGGGGTPPTAPSDVTLAVPASKVITYGGIGHGITATSSYALWKTWGFTGHNGSSEVSRNGFDQSWKGSTAAGDASPGIYDWQKAYEGLGSPSINGGVSGTDYHLGIFRARQSDPTLTAGLVRGINPGNQGVAASANTIGDMYVGANRAGECLKLQRQSEFLKFIGGTSYLLDLEFPSGWTATGGHTQAELNTILEQFGYDVGIAIWQTANNRALELQLYYWIAEGSWHAMISAPTTPAPYTPMPAPVEIARTYFIYGLFRAHMDSGATSRIRFFDHLWYRGVQFSGASFATALKWNTQGRLAVVSRGLAPAIWSHIAPLLDISPFSWAGTDGYSDADWVARGSNPNEPHGYYGNTQELQPTYTDNLEWYRKYGMGGVRAEFNFNSGSGGYGTPGINATTGGQGKWVGGNNYLTPAGRIAGMQAATSTSGSYSTTAPTLSASMSGSGSTRTVSGTAAHAYGIRCIKVYIYPSGTPVYAQMTFNLGGGTPTTNINNSFMDWTANLTGVSAGNYAIVTAYSTLGQEHSTVVAL